jgi:hypothetical protein
MPKLSAIDDLRERVSELEKYQLEHGRPPSRLGNAIRFVVEYQDALREIVEMHRKSTGQ